MLVYVSSFGMINFWYDAITANLDNSENRKAEVDFEPINRYVSRDH
jgi:hypothetical protein